MLIRTTKEGEGLARGDAAQAGTAPQAPASAGDEGCPARVPGKAASGSSVEHPRSRPVRPRSPSRARGQARPWSVAPAKIGAAGQGPLARRKRRNVLIGERRSRTAIIEELANEIVATRCPSLRDKRLVERTSLDDRGVQCPRRVRRVRNRKEMHPEKTTSFFIDEMPSSTADERGAAIEHCQHLQAGLRRGAART